MDDDTGYELDDPKHPTYHDRMSEVWDSRDKTEPEVPVTVITDEGVQAGVLVGNEIRVPASWKAEVFTEGKWYDNAIRFRTREEAELYANDLFNRWLVPTDKRAVESDDPPTHQIVDGVMSRIEES
jgi:hypothetical protein